MTVEVEASGTTNTSSTTICEGTSTPLQVSGGSSYSWSPTTGLSNPTIANPIASPTETTVYTVAISDGQGGCEKVDQITVNVVEINTSISSTTNICQGESIQLEASGGGTYSWSPSNSLNSSTISNPIATPTETTTYTVTIADNNQCTSVRQVIIGVYQLNTTISENANICAGSSTQLLASGGTTYRWNPQAGLDDPNIPNPMASPTTTTTYTVLITDDNGCTATKNVTVTVGTGSTTVGPDQRICFGDSIALSATGGLSYSWTPATGLSNTTIANPIANPSSTTTYTVVSMESTGCTSVHTQTVEVVSVFAEIQGDTLLCVNESTTLTACLLYTSPSPRDRTRSRMPSSA